jgi:DNA uptake protein ComE-like DNA-binding protein
MGIEFTNVRVMTKEQHETEVLKNRAEQYRQLALGQENEIVRLQRKLKRIRKERKTLVSDVEGYVKVANEYAAENHSLVRQLASAIQKLNEAERLAAEKLKESLKDPQSDVSQGLIASFGEIGRDSAQNTVERMCSRPLTDKDFTSLVPHHGPGLSEAEDAIRETE